MDNVLTDDTVCFFTRSSSDTEIVGVSIIDILKATQIKRPNIL